MTNEKVYTIKEVSEILRVSEQSVRRYINKGKLKAVKIGYWRIKESDLNDFMKTEN